MTKEEATFWLDNAVLIASSKKSLNGKYGIEFCDTNLDKIHIFVGLPQICKALGVEPEKVVCRNNYDFPVELRFKYKGFVFFEKFKAMAYPEEVQPIYKISEQKALNEMSSNDEPLGIFKDIKKSFDEFDKATGNLHAELGTLGVVE